MTGSSVLADSASRPSNATTESSRRGNWSSPPRWLWPLSVVLQVVSAVALTSYTYFFIDDWMFLQQARTSALNLTYLRAGLFEHFSPITRLLNKALVGLAPGSFALAHGVQLALYAAAVLAFALVVRTILGNTWAAFALTVAFGQSLFVIHLLNWWTATANILPNTTFMLVATAGYLRWRATRSRAWLLVSVGAYAGALLDYENGMLFPIYLSVFVVLAVEDDFSPRAWLRLLTRERSIWACYALLEAVAIFNYYRYYYSPVPHPTPGQLARFLEIALFEGFVPALFGISDPHSMPGQHVLVIAAVDVLAAAVAVAALYRRPRALRLVAAFVIVFLVSMVPVGLNRVRLFGVTDGHELYYQQSVQFMFLLLVAVVVSLRRAGAPAPAWSRLVKAGRGQLPRATSAIACALAIGGYAALFVTSVHALAKASPAPQRARGYVVQFDSSVARARAQTGSTPVLIDHEISADLMPFIPFNRYSLFLPIAIAQVRFDRADGPTYVLDSKGRLLPIRFAGDAVGLLARATVSDTNQLGARPAARGPWRGSVCVAAGRPPSLLRVPLSLPRRVSPQSNGLPFGVRLNVWMSARATVSPLLVNGHAVASDAGYPQTLAPGPRDVYVPLTLVTRVDAIALELPGGTCVRGLALGHFVFSGRPI